MKILLAGASGVVGRQLVPLLVAAGHDVTATTRRAERKSLLTNLGAAPLLMDALQPASVGSAVRTARPDAIIHQLTDLTEFDYAANARLRVDGTRNLVDAAIAAGVDRMIAQNISWIFGPGTTAATENDPINRSMPGIPELEDNLGELPDGVVLRYGLLYGPGTWFSADGAQAVAARSGTLAPMAQSMSFVHVEDAARAAVAALDWPKGPVNIVDDEPAPASEWMPIFAAAVGAPAPKIPKLEDPGRAVSNALARSRGWRPLHLTWREGFASLSA